MGELMVNPGAIKKNTQDIGNLSNLTTTEKSSLVGAVNELDSDVGTLNTAIANLCTTKKTKALQGGNTGTNTQGSITYIQIGKCVFFSGWTSSTAASTGVNGLFSGLPPSAEIVDFPCTGGDANNPYPYWEMRPDNGMRNYADINGKAYCSGVYFTA